MNTTHRYIRTYYTRMHEAKFLMGAIAGEMAENDKIVYIADYPILGTIAQINAFALGAQMTNPRAKVYLEWSTLKEQDIEKRIDEIDRIVFREKILSYQMIIIIFMEYIIAKVAEVSRRILQCHCATGENSMKN